MPRIPLEAESSIASDGSSLHRPLLSDAARGGDVDDDDDAEILSQLMSINNERPSRRRRCQRKYCRWPFLAASFACLIWMGVFSSVWSAFSCDLVAVDYPAGGVQLSITAVGIWSYQREVVDDTQNNNSGHNDIHQKTRKECVAYGTKQSIHHGGADMKDFFPSNKTLQLYSIMASSFYFAAILSYLFWLLIISMHPEALSQSEIQQYPATGITATVAASAVLHMNAGIFHLLSLDGLLHYSDNDKSSSPICNSSYSHCHLGPGGHWAAYAIFSAFVTGSVLCSAACFVGRRAR